MFAIDAHCVIDFTYNLYHTHGKMSRKSERGAPPERPIQNFQFNYFPLAITAVPEAETISILPWPRTS